MTPEQWRAHCLAVNNYWLTLQASLQRSTMKRQLENRHDED
jgi:hypothetical protein